MTNHDPYISKEFADGRVDRKLRMLEGVARILSENWNVTVVFSKEGECKTNQETMILPYDKEVDEALLLGLCGHETGHLKYTEFGIGRVIARHKKIRNRALLYIVFNVLEDVRIEYEMEMVYPGFQEMFRRLLPYIKIKKQPALDREEKIKQMILAGKSQAVIEAAIAKDCQEEIINLRKALEEAGFSKEYIQFEVDQLKKCQETAFPEVQKILDVVYLMLRKYDHTWYPAEIVDFVEKHLIETGKEVYDCKNSQEVLEVAIKVYQILAEHDEQLDKEKNEKEKEDNDQNGEGEQQEGADPQSESQKNRKKQDKKQKEQEKGKGKNENEDKDGEEEENGEGTEEEGGQEDEDGEEAGDEDEGAEDEDNNSSTLRVKPGQVLKIGSKVTHLHDSTKRGVVTRIDNVSSEVEVEWQ